MVDVADLQKGLSNPEDRDQRSLPLAKAGRFGFLGLVTAWQLGLMLSLVVESTRIKQRLLVEGSPGEWWDAPAWDGTLFVPLLLFAPFCWGVPWQIPASSRIARFWRRMSDESPPSVTEQFIGATFVFLLSLLISWAAARFPIPNEKPDRSIASALPLVQDEFSYQLQAKGILQGRWWWPGPPVAPELFHQMHVLNEGRFASRYFPGTGLWLTPWVAFDRAIWGARVAGALAAAGFFLIGCRLGGPFVGAVAGILLALSPAWAIFNNLLLAHAPTLLGLSLFLLGMVQLVTSESPRSAVIAGTGLTFAMLCRPLTAAAIGLPWGLWFLWQWMRSILFPRESEAGQRSKWTLSACGLGVPLLFGFLLIGIQNQAVTGSPFLTGYQQYTRLYTPRHAFGFHQTGSQNDPGSEGKILTAYDQWADDLDMPRAIANGIQRLKGSLAWSMGLIPLSMTALILLFTLPWQPRTVQLLGASIISLNLTHIPYWLDGMLGHHYVLESGALWILLFAIISRQVLDLSFQRKRFLPALWWSIFVLCCLVMNLFPVGPRGQSRLAAGWVPFLRSTAGYRAFESTIKDTPLKLPALILVRPTEADLHALYVRNEPPFDADILIGMESPQQYSLEEVASLFPERHLYLYDSATRSLQLRSPALRTGGGRGD